MADSSILVSGLAAIGGVGQVALTWSVGIVPCLSYLMLDKVEIWASPTTNRAGATKVGEILGTNWVHVGLSRSTTRFYWIRARDFGGNLGEWYPVSATAGIAATTRDEVPPAGSVGPDQVQPNAITADKIDVTDLSAITANLGTINAGTINGVVINGSTLRTAESGPRVEISAGENAVTLYPGGVTPAAIFRAISNNTVLAISWAMSSPLVTMQNTSSGATLRLIGNGSSPAVLDVTNEGGISAGFDGARMRNSRPGGGVVLLGRSNNSGGYAVYAQSGGYGPFTGQHDALLRKADEVEIGDIVIDEKVISRSGVDDTLTLVRVSDEPSQLAALGVVSRRTALDPAVEFAALRRSDNEKSEAPTFLMRRLADRYDLLTVNSVGEGQINVCGRAGNIKAGELLITSSMRGKAERQPDLGVYAVTVAKAREAVTFEYPDQVRRVACIYLCG